MALPWQHPTMLAPMEGVSHPTFRSIIAERGGVGVLCTEFVRISRAPLSAPRLRREVVKAAGVPLSVQVMGNEADKMAEAAEVVAEAGADVVDINLGCPMPRVVRKGVGAAMLKDLVLLRNVLEAMRQRTPVLLSAKIRAGYDDAGRSVEIARVVEDSGVDFITVHPRRRCDFYEGKADWRIIRDIKSALSIPVVGNGDIWRAEDAFLMQAETQCDAVMIGRAALRNPWIFSQIEALRRQERPPNPDGNDVAAYFESVADRYDREMNGNAIGKMKEIVRYLGRAIDDSGTFLRDALRSSSLAEMVHIVVNSVRDRSAEELDFGAHAPVN